MTKVYKDVPLPPITGPSPRTRKLFSLPQCILLGRVSQRESAFWFDIKREDLFLSFSFRL